MRKLQLKRLQIFTRNTDQPPNETPFHLVRFIFPYCSVRDPATSLNRITISTKPTTAPPLEALEIPEYGVRNSVDHRSLSGGQVFSGHSRTFWNVIKIKCGTQCPPPLCRDREPSKMSTRLTAHGWCGANSCRNNRELSAVGWGGRRPVLSPAQQCRRDELACSTATAGPKRNRPFNPP